MQGLSRGLGGRFTPPVLLLLLLMLLAVLLPLANGFCEYPLSWTGRWFQYGSQGDVIVNSTVLDGKTCYENQKDKYIVYRKSDDCYQCMIINKRHKNVIQFRETYCQFLAPLDEMCDTISSDENLNSMFRLDATPITCPFAGPPFTFSYSRGHGECSYPESHAESCTDESRLLLKYQACPDVHGTESSTEELQCLATWKDGRNKYLVGTIKSVDRGVILSHGDTFRCFLYEKTAHHPGKVIYELAQSGDASCNGLTSVSEGSRTINLTKVDKEHIRCKYPSWVTEHHEWHSLDGSRRYHFTIKNATLRVRSQDSNDDNFHEEKIVCHHLEKLYPNDNMQGHRVKLVAHITSGCDSGYVCMIYHKRDGHVIELQQSSKKSIVPDEPCSSSDPSMMPYTTLITSTLHQKKCPQPGHYSIVGFTPSNLQQPLLRRQSRSAQSSRAAKRRVMQEEEEEEECRNNAIDIGCSSSGQNEMIIANTCDRTEPSYSCHGSWEENGTWYTIVSQKSSDLTLDSGQTYCFSMRRSDVADKLSGRGRTEHYEQELSLSFPARTCQRDTTDQMTYTLMSQGVCEDLTKAASSTASSSSLSRVSLVLSSGAALLCTLLSR